MEEPTERMLALIAVEHRRMVSGTHIRVRRLVDPRRICISGRASDIKCGILCTQNSAVSTVGMKIASVSRGMVGTEVNGNAALRSTEKVLVDVAFRGLNEISYVPDKVGI